MTFLFITQSFRLGTKQNPYMGLKLVVSPDYSYNLVTLTVTSTLYKNFVCFAPSQYYLVWHILGLLWPYQPF